jgi:hypothetical protein
MSITKTPINKFLLEVSVGVAIVAGLWCWTYVSGLQNDTTLQLAASDVLPEDAQSDSRHNVAGFASYQRVAWVPLSEFSRREEYEAEQRLNKMMQEQRVGELSFPGKTPLSNILEILAAQLSQIEGRLIQFRPDHGPLSDESIPSLHELKITDIKIPAGLMTAGSALDYILSQTDPPLTWIARDELLLITTKSFAEAEESLLLRSYDISRLYNTTVRNQQVQTFASSQSLMQSIVDLSAPPCRWYEIDGEGGRLIVVGNRLLVRQSRDGHLIIAKIIAEFEGSVADRTTR